MPPTTLVTLLTTVTMPLNMPANMLIVGIRTAVNTLAKATMIGISASSNFISGGSNFSISEKKPIKILGTGELKKTVTIKAHKVSESAKSKLAAAGAKIEVLA